MTGYRAWITGKRKAAWRRAGRPEIRFPTDVRDHVCSWCRCDPPVSQAVPVEPEAEPQLELSA